MASIILNNIGILENIFVFLDCKSMKQLSLTCKQLSSDVNEIKVRRVKRLKKLSKTLVEQSLNRDNIDYDSVSVYLTSLNSGRYRATIIVVSNDVSSMGDYCIEQQKYISKAVFVDLTRSYGLGGVQGIVRSPREIMEKEDKQVMTNEQDNANLLPNNTKSHLNNVKMTSETILNNPGILEHIVGFLDCKSMVHLSLVCKQLSSDVNTIAGRILNSAERFAARHDVRGITVFEELNNHRTTCRIIANTGRLLDRFVLKTYELFVNGTVGLAKLVHDKNDPPVRTVSGEVLARILGITDQILINLDNGQVDTGYKELMCQVEEVYDDIKDEMAALKCDTALLASCLGIPERHLGLTNNPTGIWV